MPATRPVPIPRWREKLPSAVVHAAIDVAREIDVDVEHFFNGSAGQQIRRGRQQVMARLRHGNPDMTLHQIAGYFRVDHSTVAHAAKRYARRVTEVKPDATGNLHRSNLREDSKFLSGHPGRGPA